MPDLPASGLPTHGAMQLCGRCRKVTFQTIKPSKGLTIHTCRTCGHAHKIYALRRA